MQHRQQSLQLRCREPLRGKPLLKSLADFLAARLPVEHLQDRKLFLLESVIAECERILDRPILPPLPPLPPRNQILPPPEQQGAGRSRQESRHRSSDGACGL